MKLLFIGDIVGRPGRETVKKAIPAILKANDIKFVIMNGENAAGGAGITPAVSDELSEMGADAITLGNHAWKRKEVFQIIDREDIVRPANYPPDVPGKGYTIINKDSVRVAVVNLMGRVYMSGLDCPFRTADSVIEEIKRAGVKNIFLDFHAEITSEKITMGWYLDGKVTAVIGTHTHVQTADERVLPQGTAYVTDAGMTGARDSVIGVKKEIVIKKYLTQMPMKFEVAENDPVISAVVIDFNENRGRANGIKRIFESVKNG